MLRCMQGGFREEKVIPNSAGLRVTSRTMCVLCSSLAAQQGEAEEREGERASAQV